MIRKSSRPLPRLWKISGRHSFTAMTQSSAHECPAYNPLRFMGVFLVVRCFRRRFFSDTSQVRAACIVQRTDMEKRESRGAGIRGAGNVSFPFFLPVWKTEVLLRFLEEEFFSGRGWLPVFPRCFLREEGGASRIFLREHGGTTFTASVCKAVVLHRQKKFSYFCTLSAGKGCRRLKKKAARAAFFCFCRETRLRTYTLCRCRSCGHGDAWYGLPPHRFRGW